MDKDVARHGRDFYGIRINAPETLLDHENEFDYLLAANYTRFPEIKQQALALGIVPDKIKYINELEVSYGI